MKYRKKQIVVEAFQMTEERRMDNSEWPIWLHQAWNHDRNEPGALQRVDMDAEMPDALEIATLEGNHRVSWGDWIIQGVQGEIYPCKPDIFAATYEAVPSCDQQDTSNAPPMPQHEYEVEMNKQLRRDIDDKIQTVESLPPSRERSLAVTKLQEAVMWLGMDLKRLNEPNPYPNSKDPSNTTIEPTADGLKL